MRHKAASKVLKIATTCALIAALIFALPADALACTQIYVGSSLTETGDTYVGRSEDYATRYAKFFGVQESLENPTYTSDESSFSWTYEGTSYRYTYVRDAADAWGEDMPYSEAGTNEKGVSVSATETTNMNSAIRAVDPLSSTGIGEFNIADVVLGTSATAREGVKRLGSLIDVYGSSEYNQIIIADSNETWLFMQLSGHQWIAIVMPDDQISVNPNLGCLQFEVDLDNESVCLHSEDIVKVAQEAKTYTCFEDGSMNVAASYGAASSSSSRYVQGHLYFGDELEEGVDYTVSGSSVTSITDPQLFFTPSSSDTGLVSLYSALRSFAARGEQSDSPAVNANRGASSSIGSQRTSEAHLFQIRSGLSSDIATIEWIALSPAEFNVFLPVYGALLTEVDETYFPANDAYRTRLGQVIEGAMDGAESTYLDRIFMDINTLASENENRSTMADGVLGYLEAIQESILDQQKVIDEIMRATPAGSERTELANAALQATADALYDKASTLLTEMRDYVDQGDTTAKFVPSDYDEVTGSMRTPFAYVAALYAPTITSQPSSATYEVNEPAEPLSVTAETAYAGETLSYQWYVANGLRSAGENLTGFTAIDGAQASSYTPDTSSAGTKTYVVVVRNEAGLTVTSDPVTVTIKATTSEKPDTSAPGSTDGTDGAGSTGSSTSGTTTPAAQASSSESTGSLPKTGDTTSFAAVAALLALGTAFLAAGAYDLRRRQTDR